MAAIANLTIDQGATFSSDVTVKDANNNAFNLTGYTAQAKMAKGFQSTKTRTTITCTIAADATTGVITLSLTADQTSNLEDGRYCLLYTSPSPRDPTKSRMPSSA